ncbi:energy transducer TonB [Caulobacter sp. S45]|uniref:energy transducer TonB n=1 Tax=Caulobacter sp. S45 TaxID=1641861 RepID=UPI00131E5A5D|nr:energy transducer TonB [Caulobacter sp. S45]
MRIDRIGIALCSLGLSAVYPLASSAQTSSEANVADTPAAAGQIIHWEKIPSKGDLSNYEPERAQRMAQNGESSMRCKLLAAGTLTDCAITSENPPGFAFGVAMIKISKFFKATPTSEDRMVSILVHWDWHYGDTSRIVAAVTVN